jgi:calcium/proton exchanger cax
MKALLKEIRDNPLLWLLFFVPVVFIAGKVWPESHTLLFLLSVLAIVPLATLLSHATESVAAKTGDAVGGLLNATLGNLTELVIALAALRAGQTMLVKATIAGAIVTNTLFMLGRRFSSAASNTTRRNTTGSAPDSRPGCSFWPRSHSWSRRRSPKPIPRQARRSQTN